MHLYEQCSTKIKNTSWIPPINCGIAPYSLIHTSFESVRGNSAHRSMFISQGGEDFSEHLDTDEQEGDDIQGNLQDLFKVTDYMESLSKTDYKYEGFSCFANFFRILVRLTPFDTPFR